MGNFVMKGLSPERLLFNSLHEHSLSVFSVTLNYVSATQ